MSVQYKKKYNGLSVVLYTTEGNSSVAFRVRVSADGRLGNPHNDSPEEAIKYAESFAKKLRLKMSVATRSISETDINKEKNFLNVKFEGVKFDGPDGAKEAIETIKSVFKSARIETVEEMGGVDQAPPNNPTPRKARPLSARPERSHNRMGIAPTTPVAPKEKSVVKAPQDGEIEASTIEQLLGNKALPLGDGSEVKFTFNPDYLKGGFKKDYNGNEIILAEASVDKGMQMQLIADDDLRSFRVTIKNDDLDARSEYGKKLLNNYLETMVESLFFTASKQSGASEQQDDGGISNGKKKLLKVVPKLIFDEADYDHDCHQMVMHITASDDVFKEMPEDGAPENEWKPKGEWEMTPADTLKLMSAFKEAVLAAIESEKGMSLGSLSGNSRNAG